MDFLGILKVVKIKMSKKDSKNDELSIGRTEKNMLGALFLRF